MVRVKTTLYRPRQLFISHAGLAATVIGLDGMWTIFTAIEEGKSELEVMRGLSSRRVWDVPQYQE
jgi:hypothetical protein